MNNSEFVNQINQLVDEHNGYESPEDIRSYLRSLIFYKYLDLKQQQNSDEVLGYEIKPEFSWKSIINIASMKTFSLKDIDKAIKDFDTNSTHFFTGIFGDLIRNSHQSQQQSINKGKLMAELIKLVDSIDSSTTDTQKLVDTFNQLISLSSKNIRSASDNIYTPKDVTDLLARIVSANINKQEDTTIYDMTCGSGSLMLTVGTEASQRTTFYGEDINNSACNLAKMNLIINGYNYKDITLRVGDSLDEDWPDTVNSDGQKEPQTFNAVASVPPFSLRWNNSDDRANDPRFVSYGVAPKTKADYAFLLQGLYHLNNEGTMVILLPHGVLFRGAKEKMIRKSLLEKNEIDAIIGLPAGLFNSTSIPTVILVLKKNKKSKNVLFIDASKEFQRGKKKNILKESNIRKIVQIYKDRKELESFSHLANWEELVKNDFNLNIPRYVDTFVPEKSVNLHKVVEDLEQTNKDIKKVQSELSALLESFPSKSAKDEERKKAIIKSFD